MVNVIILKQLVIKKGGNDFEHHYKYPIAALFQSSELISTKFAGLKVFQPTLQVTIPVTKIIKKPPIQKASQNLKQRNKKTARLFLSFLPLLEDNEIENSKTRRGDSQGLRGMIYPGQDKQVQFNN